ncbi:MAG: D-inositol-3-phosphate glycosyltransferase [Myxococcota bacterium]|nr:D-inositol-3-phosphate glycosyltransferase [Myxococcota bacterium]
MNILFVTPWFEPEFEFGGIPRAASDLARALAARGHVITVYTGSGGAADPGRSLLAEYGAGRVEVVRVPLLSRRAHRMGAPVPLGPPPKTTLRGERFDLAHLHGRRHLFNTLAMNFCRRLDIPWVFSAHGTAPLIEGKIAVKRLADLAGGNRDIRLAARLLAVSGAERDQLTALGADPRLIEVIPNPVNLDDLEGPADPAGVRARLGVPEGAPLVLFLAKITPRKGLADVISAMADPRLARAHLAIAGDALENTGPYHAQIRRLGAGDRIHWAGFADGAEKRSLIRAANVMAYPAVHEIFGLAAFESMALGVPVAAANDCGMGEWFRQQPFGCEVTPGDSHQLAGALAGLIENPPPHDAWVQARDFIRRRFHADAVAGSLEAAYRAAIQKSR